MKLNYAWIFIPLLIILGVYYFYYSGKDEPEGSSGLRSVLSVDEEKLKSMEIRHGEEIIRLAREKGRWRITSPISSPAGEGEVGDLLEAIANLDVGRSLGLLEESGKAQYGLDNPDFRMDLFGDGGNILLSIEVGQENPDGSSRYFSAGTGELYTVKSNALSFMDVSVTNLRSTVVLDVRPKAVSSFECSTNDVDFAFRRDADLWYLTKPREFRVQEGWCEAYLTILDRVRAEEFVPAPDLSGLVELNGGVRIIDNAGKEHTITFLGVDKRKGVLAKSSYLPEPFLTEFRLETYLNTSLEKLREDRLMLATMASVSSVVLREKGGQNLTVETTTDGFSVTKPSGMTNLTRQDFSAFFNAILKITPDQYIEDPPSAREINLDPYWIKIELYLSDGSDTMNLYIGSKTAEGYYASPDAGGQVYILSQEVLEEILRTTDKLRTLAPLIG